MNHPEILVLGLVLVVVLVDTIGADPEIDLCDGLCVIVSSEFQLVLQELFLFG